MYYWVLSLYVLSGFREKKNQNFCFFFLNDADVENCGVSRGFGFIYIYIYRLNDSFIILKVILESYFNFKSIFL